MSKELKTTKMDRCLAAGRLAKIAQGEAPRQMAPVEVNTYKVTPQLLAAIQTRAKLSPESMAMIKPQPGEAFLVRPA